MPPLSPCVWGMDGGGGVDCQIARRHRSQETMRGEGARRESSSASRLERNEISRCSMKCFHRDMRNVDAAQFVFFYCKIVHCTSIAHRVVVIPFFFLAHVASPAIDRP